MLAAGTSLSTSGAALATPLGSWLPNPPIDLSATGGNAENPQVATGPDGATTIIWRRVSGSSYIVQAATRAANATTFSTPIDVSTTGQNAGSPQVAIGPDGTTTITWHRYDGSNFIVQAATRAANATTFSTPINLSGTGGDAENPQVATGPDGTTTITWRRSNGSNYIVQAATRAAGATTFSTPIDLSATGGHAYYPQIAVAPDGTTTITWYRSNGSNTIVQAATRAANATTFSTPIDLSATLQNASSVQVATGPDGTTTITWHRFNDAGDRIVQAATRAANATTFSTPIDVSTTGQNAGSPQVAIGPDGTTTITWRRYNGSNYIVQAATRAAGATTFSTPINLSTTGQNAESPEVATGPDGTTTITWTRDNGNGPGSGPMRSTEGIVQAVTATPPPSVLTVTKIGNGAVTSTPANINCGTTCTATITNLTTITLTATPAADSTFSGWSGDCTGTSTCTVSMTDARNVTATFTLTSITPITLSATSPLPTTPTAIRWTPRTGAINKPITGSFTATTNTTYTITATSNTARSFETRATRTARGTCKITTNKKTKKRTAKCTIRFKHAGTWLVKITPTQNGVTGTPATKTIKIRAAAKKTRTLPTHQRQALAQR
jgi:phosphoserine aminotransferase